MRACIQSVGEEMDGSNRRTDALTFRRTFRRPFRKDEGDDRQRFFADSRLAKKRRGYVKSISNRNGALR